MTEDASADATVVPPHQEREGLLAVVAHLAAGQQQPQTHVPNATSPTPPVNPSPPSTLSGQRPERVASRRGSDAKSQKTHVQSANPEIVMAVVQATDVITGQPVVVQGSQQGQIFTKSFANAEISHIGAPSEVVVNIKPNPYPQGHATLGERSRYATAGADAATRPISITACTPTSTPTTPPARHLTYTTSIWFQPS